MRKFDLHRAALVVALIASLGAFACASDTTDADRDLTSAESSLLQAVVDYASNLARLEAAIARPI